MDLEDISEQESVSFSKWVVVKNKWEDLEANFEDKGNTIM